jgi:hypothetical protein
VLLPDDTIETLSDTHFADYGAAIHDAVLHGFAPTEDHWIVAAVHYTTHFKHGNKAVIVPNKDAAPTPLNVPRTIRPSEKSPVPRKLGEPEDQ